MTAAALEGDIRHFLPSEILQFLQLAEATGRLLLERPGERAELFLDRGRPVFARTSGGSVRLGDVLVHRGAITRQSLERALEQQRERPSERLGALLIASGSATRDQVAPAVREVLKRIVYGFMLWREGRFRFAPDERVESDDMPLDLELDRLILEGLRQADQARAAETA